MTRIILLATATVLCLIAASVGLYSILSKPRPAEETAALRAAGIPERDADRFRTSCSVSSPGEGQFAFCSVAPRDVACRVDGSGNITEGCVAVTLRRQSDGRWAEEEGSWIEEP